MTIFYIRLTVQCKCATPITELLYPGPDVVNLIYNVSVLELLQNFTLPRTRHGEFDTQCKCATPITEQLSTKDLTW